MPRRPFHSLKWPLTPTQVEAINEMFEQLFREFRRGLPSVTEFDGILEVEHGGSGRATAIPYSVITGGITADGQHQSVVSLGTLGQVLTSNDAGMLPTWEDAFGGSLDDLDDVTITAPQDGDILQYDAGDAQWENVPISDTIEATGYWTPLTDGDEDEPHLVFADAEAIMIFVATP